jgi:glycosyltransferase involved in cell wall biosynthesis
MAVSRLRITVGIPTFERLDYLKEAVVSAQELRHDDLEILISDDGTGREIGKWAHDIQAVDPRVRYRKNAHRLGLAGNWNSILDHATGHYVVIIGDDDRLLPRFIEALRPHLELGITVAFSSHYLIDASGRRLAKETTQQEQRSGRDRLLSGRLQDAGAWIWRNALPMSASLINRRIAVKQRFREELNTPEIEFFLRLNLAGATFAYVPEFLAEYRCHPRSETTKGLRTDQLAARLIEFPAGPSEHADKSRFLRGLLINAVNEALRHREHSLARRLIACVEYRECGNFLERSVQAICASLPAPVGRTLHAITMFLWKLAKLGRRPRST